MRQIHVDAMPLTWGATTKSRAAVLHHMLQMGVRLPPIPPLQGVRIGLTLDG
jgi:hypothetical protein